MSGGLYPTANHGFVFRGLCPVIQSMEKFSQSISGKSANSCGKAVKEKAVKWRTLAASRQAARWKAERRQVAKLQAATGKVVSYKAANGKTTTSKTHAASGTGKAARRQVAAFTNGRI